MFFLKAIVNIGSTVVIGIESLIELIDSSHHIIAILVPSLDSCSRSNGIDYHRLTNQWPWIKIDKYIKAKA